MRECCIEPTMSLVVYILVNPLHLRMNNRGFGISGAFGATHTGFHVKNYGGLSQDGSCLLCWGCRIQSVVPCAWTVIYTEHIKKTHEEGIALRNVVRRKKL